MIAEKYDFSVLRTYDGRIQSYTCIAYNKDTVKPIESGEELMPETKAYHLRSYVYTAFEKLETGEEHFSYGVNEPTGAKAPETPVMFDFVGETITMDELVAQFTDDELMDFVGGKAPTGVANTGCFGGPLKRLEVRDIER